MARNHLHILLLLAAFTPACVLTGMLGLCVRTGHEGITPIWPPAGIVLCAFLRFSPRMWPLIVIGIFKLGWQYGIPLLSIIIAAFGNTCEALLGWYLCRCFNIEFGKRLQDTWRFQFLPVLLARLAGASIGSVGMVPGGTADWPSVHIMCLKTPSCSGHQSAWARAEPHPGLADRLLQGTLGRGQRHRTLYPGQCHDGRDDREQLHSGNHSHRPGRAGPVS
jgi:hypothetical protein